MIYHERSIPEQWRISKIVPVHKKGAKCDIENYRPVANLCSSSRIFERLILNRILQLELAGGVDLTNECQHGFKKNRGTVTAGLQLQSLISRALDDNNFVAMASLDLSAAFDMVNIDLLLKRMKIMGLPDDLTDLISVWLRDRSFYVSVNGHNSTLYDLLLGTVQGSVLGPVLYAIFISPLFDLEDLLAFADDNYTIKVRNDIQTAKIAIESSLSTICKWMKDSGLRINESKTEACVFSRADTATITISVNNTNVRTKTEMNVLGILFDSKLKWGPQVQRALQKADKALNALRLIRRYFVQEELIQLITSNYYSVLYFNSEVWHIPTLNQSLQSKLLSASAKALKICVRTSDMWMLSLKELHEMAGRAVPAKIRDYKTALQLYKTIDLQIPHTDWINLNLNAVNTSRQTTFITNKENRFKVGMNAFSNRTWYLNGKIKQDWLNLPFNSYKIKCKRLFLNG